MLIYRQFLCKDNFVNVLMVYLRGVSASILILYLMQILEHYWSNTTLQFFGRNTLTIYLWNMILPTIFSFVVLKVTGNEIVLDKFHLALRSSNSHILISITVAPTLISGTLMTQYKKKHSETLLARLYKVFLVGKKSGGRECRKSPSVP